MLITYNSFLVSLLIFEQFDAVVESNNPMNVNSDVLNDFDFDSFLNDTAGVADDNFNFDPYLGENEISDDISTHDELRN